MSRRERMERRLERREEWAEKAHKRSDAAYGRSNQICENIPLGQPILVGHHSEKRARKDQERIHNAMNKSVAEMKKAEHHTAKARGIQEQLDRTIFSDDDDAIERLEEKIEKIENECTEAKRINAAYKAVSTKGNRKKFYDMGYGDEQIDALLDRIEKDSWVDRPFPSYYLTNRRAEVRRAKKRIEQIKIQRERVKIAEGTENGVSIVCGESGWARITFAEKPDRSVIQDLKQNKFHWSDGSWTGPKDSIPQSVKDM